MSTLFQSFKFYEVWKRRVRKNCDSTLLPLCYAYGGSCSHLFMSFFFSQHVSFISTLGNYIPFISSKWTKYSVGVAARVPNDLQTRATAKVNYFYTRVCHSKIYYNFHKMSDWAFEPLPTTSWPVQWYLCLYFLLSIIFWYGSLFGGKWKSSLLRYTQGLSWKPSPWPAFYSSYSLLYQRVKE